MLKFRIIYLGEGYIPDRRDVSSEDLVAVAQLASSMHPQLTAEIWLENRKVAVVRPCSRHGDKRLRRMEQGNEVLHCSLH